MSSSWVTQVSGDPPLIGVAVGRRHRSHAFIEETGLFALNVVGERSRHLEDYFYSPAAQREDNLRDIPHEMHASGVPVLTEVATVLVCRVRDRLAAGDHTVFITAVEDVIERPAEKPLTSQDLEYVYVGTVIRR